MFKKIKPRFTKPINHHKLSAVYVALYIAVLPMVARADVVDVLNNFFGYLTGGIGKAVAALAIVAVGFGCFAMLVALKEIQCLQYRYKIKSPKKIKSSNKLRRDCKP